MDESKCDEEYNAMRAAKEEIKRIENEIKEMESYQFWIEHSDDPSKIKMSAEKLQKVKHFFESRGGEQEIFRLREALIEAEKTGDETDEAYTVCMEKASAGHQYTKEGDTGAPARYAAPENTDPAEAEHEVM